LITCGTLVCRSWVRTSVYHLCNDGSLSLSPLNSGSFVALCKSNTFPHNKLFEIIGDLDTLDMPQALSLLREYSSPRVLAPDSVNLVPNTPSIFDSILPASGLEMVQLTNCELHPPTGVLDILSALPGLDRLNLYHKQRRQNPHVCPIRYTHLKPRDCPRWKLALPQMSRDT
jgi:hypothetical protein